MNLSSIVAFFAQRRKALGAFVALEITWATTSLPDSHVSFTEWIAQAVLLNGVLFVHMVANADPPEVN